MASGFLCDPPVVSSIYNQMKNPFQKLVMDKQMKNPVDSKKEHIGMV